MEESLHLVPRPRTVERRAGSWALAPHTLICLAAGADDDDLFAARQLQAEIAQATGLTLAIERQLRPHQRQDTIILLRAERDRAIFPPADFGWEPPAQALPDQAYQLTISAQGAVVVAESAAGLFYGVQTLRQLVRLHAPALPQVYIDDRPALAERGVMLDVCRAKVPTLATLLELVEKLSFFKINQFQMHNEQAFYFPHHPDIGANGARLTNEEILELDAHCRRHHIELVPNLQSFGHMQNILSLPQYRHLAETEMCWSIAPTEEGYRFLDELYGDFLPAFSSRQLNINCDETYDLGQGRSEARCAQIGPGRLYLEHILRVRELAARHGKRLQMWGDILLQHPEVIDDLPQDITLLDWHYEAEETYPSVALFAQQGRRFLVCPGTSSWNTLFPRIDNANSNIRTLAREGAAYGASGLLNTDWGDHGHYQPLGQSFYGYAFGAEQAWTGGQTPDDVFDPAFGRLFFGPEQGEAVVRAIRQLGAVNLLPGLARPNASFSVYALFDEPLNGMTIEGLPPESLQGMRQAGAEAEAAFNAAAPGNREALTLREMAFSARLMAEAGEKVALSQRIRADWQSIAASVLKKEDALAEIDQWLAALDQHWEKMLRLRAEFIEIWQARAKPGGIGQALQNYRDVLARFDVAAYWLRTQRQALAAGKPLDGALASYGLVDYRILWERRALM